MDTQARNFLVRPKYWLMYALPWPAPRDAEMAEAAYAVAPPTISKHARDALPKDVADVLGFADVYAHEHPEQRVVWFTDVTRWLEWEKDTSWAGLGVDWEQALSALPELPLLGTRMTISQRAYQHLINTAERFELRYLDGSSEVLTDDERQAVHEAFARKLSEDWPEYVDDMVKLGLLTID